MQPSTPEQKRVLAMLRAADRDMETAESLVQHSPHLYESIGFSCQQAVEKYSKAVLIAYMLLAPFVHVLVKLLLPLNQAGIVSLNDVEWMMQPSFKTLPWSSVTKPTTRPLIPRPTS